MAEARHPLVSGLRIISCVDRQAAARAAASAVTSSDDRRVAAAGPNDFPSATSPPTISPFLCRCARGGSEISRGADPSLRGQAIAVGGGVVLAASYEAKALGCAAE